MSSTGINKACAQIDSYRHRVSASRCKAIIDGYIGSGSLRPEVMIISGLPSKEERNSKILGMSGQGISLTVMLNKLGLNFEDAYWTTAIKEDEFIGIDQIESNRSKLINEISSLHPEIIITVGNLATTVLFGEKTPWDSFEVSGFNVHNNLPDIPVYSIPNISMDTPKDFKISFGQAWSRIKGIID